jgi:dephospho-CoA kinase
MDRMKTIGLVGGVASGKSLVAQLFVELGAGLLDADHTGHEVLAHDPEVQQAIFDRWGSKVVDADGSLNRRAIAACVFSAGDAAKHDRQFLENLLHPRIGAILAEKKSQYAAAGTPAAVLDAPLLLEANWGPLCDVIVMVEADRNTRLTRAQQRGWDAAEFARREASQWPAETLANTGSIEELREAVREIWNRTIAG